MNVRIGIVGGGFTGAVFAVHLANASSVPLDIEIIEPREKVGAGLAYGSASAEHRINVPSDRLTVFREEPLHFTQWLKARGEWNADPDGLTGPEDHYSTRHAFGAYVADLVRKSSENNTSGSIILHRRNMATALERTAERWRVTFDSGESATYDEVVVCTTYGAPAFRWTLAEGAEELPHLVRNPWDWDAIRAIPADGDVVIIGTGLTMCDAVVTLRVNGHRGRIRAISRRALTPREHGEFDSSFDLFEDREPPLTAIGLLRLVRTRIGDAASEGRAWHPVVDAVRRNLATYWRTLPIAERGKIARHLRAYWDVHRFRMAPQVASLLAEGKADEWFTLSAGRIDRIGRTGSRFRIDWTPKGGSPGGTEADAIINCTGPDSDLRRTRNPFVQAAMKSGLLRPDALRIGFDVDADGRLLDSGGEVSPGLWAAGPLARAIVGEATGVPEASAHARHVAEALAASLDRAVLIAREVPLAVREI
ncbi:FAD/NAD(P)-binding protein [Flaviflagellibacter deserti]|uniref:FAD/NAD(P)-binding protein n=1 Tax=Flaviflagellibacter deserti TaxID=2267266 RepID=A0ABV9ZAG7_9HYPH